MWITFKCNSLTAKSKIFTFYFLHKFQNQLNEGVLNKYIFCRINLYQQSKASLCLQWLWAFKPVSSKKDDLSYRRSTSALSRTYFRLPEQYPFHWTWTGKNQRNHYPLLLGTGNPYIRYTKTTGIFLCVAEKRFTTTLMPAFSMSEISICPERQIIWWIHTVRYFSDDRSNQFLQKKMTP